MMTVSAVMRMFGRKGGLKGGKVRGAQLKGNTAYMRALAQRPRPSRRRKAA